MEYRKIGQTNMQASIIGLGCEHLDGKPYSTVEETIHAAIDNDINFMDVFMPGEEVRSNIGRALVNKRDKVIIQGHICSTDIREQYDISRDLKICKKYFEALLKALKTDYIDIGMLFFIDSEEDFNSTFNSDIIEYVLDLKQKGVIRAIGASSHNPVTAAEVVKTNLVDLIMFSVNPAFDLMSSTSTIMDMLSYDSKKNMVNANNERATFYRLCEQHNVSISCMKTLGAGKLLSKEHTPFASELSVIQCLHYALTRPAVVSALLGCQSQQQIEDAVSYLVATDSQKDYSKVISNQLNNFTGHCLYCGHCQPCPVNIDIAKVHKYLDIARLDLANIPPSIKQHYLALDAHASNCIGCTSCQKRCPFNVEVINNMAQCAKIFGK